MDSTCHQAQQDRPIQMEDCGAKGIHQTTIKTHPEDARKTSSPANQKITKRNPKDDVISQSKSLWLKYVPTPGFVQQKHIY